MSHMTRRPSIGGPARWIAEKHGCLVTGVDLIARVWQPRAQSRHPNCRPFQAAMGEPYWYRCREDCDGERWLGQTLRQPGDWHKEPSAYGPRCIVLTTQRDVAQCDQQLASSGLSPEPGIHLEARWRCALGLSRLPIQCFHIIA